MNLYIKLGVVFFGIFAALAPLEAGFAAMFFLAAGIIVLFAGAVDFLASKSKKGAERAVRGLRGEWGAVEKAKPKHPDFGKTAAEYSKTLGQRTAEVMFSPPEHKYSSNGFWARVEKSSKSLFDSIAKWLK